MKRINEKWIVLWMVAGCLLVASSSPAQEGSKTIRDKGDLLPPSVVKSLDKDDCLNLLRTPTGRTVPLFVLVNPVLNPKLLRKLPEGRTEEVTEKERQLDMAKLKKRILLWAEKDEQKFPDAILNGLTTLQDGAPVVYGSLKETSIDFLRKFFGDKIQSGERLFDLIQGNDYQGNVLLVAGFDVRCWTEKESGKNMLVVKLIMKLQRLVINRNKDPQWVDNIELLFRDEAEGRAALPDFNHLKDGEEVNRQVQDAYQIAMVAALRKKIALSLWHNARMSEKPWAFGVRENIVSPSLSGTK